VAPTFHDEGEDEDGRIEEQFFGIKEGGILRWDIGRIK
jgi:hypothetical protein